MWRMQKSRIQSVDTDSAVWGQNQGWMLGLKVVGAWGQAELDRNKMGCQAEMERMGDPPKTNTQEVKSSNLLGAKCSHSVVYNNLVMNGWKNRSANLQVVEWPGWDELLVWGEAWAEGRSALRPTGKMEKHRHKKKTQKSTANPNISPPYHQQAPKGNYLVLFGWVLWKSGITSGSKMKAQGTQECSSGS